MDDAAAVGTHVRAVLEEEAHYRLSRHIQLEPLGDGFVAHSLVSGQREDLPNSSAVRLLLSFKRPVRPRDLIESFGTEQAPLVLTVIERWLHKQLLTEVLDDGRAEEDRIDSLCHWQNHDLAFHLRSRRGRNTAPVGATWHLAGTVPREPVRRPKHAGIIDTIALPTADIARLEAEDWPLTRALEHRRSRYSTRPLSISALGELLYRTCRVTGDTGVSKQDGPMIRKVYPSGGSLHSLETYVVSNRCIGLPSGGFHYDPYEHKLEWIRRLDSQLLEILDDAQNATLKLDGLPAVLLIFASRFRRVTRKYESLAYRAILQEVGTLYQTIYLVAETMSLAVSAIGSGNSDRFAEVFGTDFFAESSVGEMIVGGGLE